MDDQLQGVRPRGGRVLSKERGACPRALVHGRAAWVCLTKQSRYFPWSPSLEVFADWCLGSVTLLSHGGVLTYEDSRAFVKINLVPGHR